jgi:hypothetical protein
MNNQRMTEAEMAEEAQRWAEGKIPLGEFVDAPEAAPRAGESVAISIRLPKKLVEILKGFARRSDIGYQVLIKRWLDDRLQLEHKRLREERARQKRQQEELAQRQMTFNLKSPTIFSQAAAFDARGVIELRSVQTDRSTDTIAVSG